jgi:hypothetical protein
MRFTVERLQESIWNNKDTAMNRQDLRVHPDNSVTVVRENEDRDKRIHGPQQSKDRLTVSFQSIEIREFNRIVGDHPDVTNGGPPLTIGWDYVQQPALRLEDYEKGKNERPSFVRRLSSGRRRDLLRIDFQIPLEEILMAEEQVQRVKKQRAQSNRPNKVLGFMEATKLLKLSRRFSRELPESKSKARDPVDTPKTSAISTSTGISEASKYQLQQSQQIRVMPLPTPMRIREVSV